jgi:hypothetical protein
VVGQVQTEIGVAAYSRTLAEQLELVIRSHLIGRMHQLFEHNRYAFGQAREVDASPFDGFNNPVIRATFVRHGSSLGQTAMCSLIAIDDFEYGLNTEKV